TSAMIFGPARRRLRALEAAARKLGTGDLSARAPDRGGDEIAAVASAFNAMADDLAARANALATSDRVRRQLLADVSHELTTPITAMRGYLETLTMPEVSLDEATRARYLAIIGDETHRLERLIGDAIRLSVEDAGAGIAPEHLPHVFDRFYNGDPARSGASGGSGLGLSIVKAIVERHGGALTVESRPGRTVFEMKLEGRT